MNEKQIQGVLNAIMETLQDLKLTPVSIIVKDQQGRTINGVNSQICPKCISEHLKGCSEKLAQRYPEHFNNDFKHHLN